MQVTKHELEPCTVELDIHVEPETVSKAYGQAYREFGQFTSVPGFRPGKAPRKMVERYVNQDRLRERVRELVAAPAYRAALEQESITPYADPEVEFSDLAEGEPWQFKAVIPMPPRVELGDYTTIAVERPVYAVTDDAIDRQVEGLRREHARMEKVDDRGVEADDVVIAEMSIAVKGSEEEGEPPVPRRTLIRMGDNIPGFDAAVMGQRQDEERTFDLTFPGDYQDKERAGKEAAFTVRVAAINRRVLPDVTDEWVAEVTPYKTVEELRGAIRGHLEEQFRDLSDRIAEGRILDELVKRSKIDFPTVMVRQEMDDEAHELNGELEQRKMTYEEYLEATDQTEEQHVERMQATAFDRVQTVLVLRELARTLDLEVTNDEVAEELARLVVAEHVPEEEARKMVRDERQRARVVNAVIRRKLRDRLFTTVSITDVPTPTEPQSEPS